MEKDRQTKIIAIVALFIGVATLTLGFATFSAKLIIQTKAEVTPNADSFKVLLSKEQNSVIEGKVNPSGIGDAATINNTGTPTISGLKAKFVNPGEKVVYDFFAVNTSKLDAFLSKIDYENVPGKTVNKVCTASEGTTASYVERACNNIRVTVKVGEDDKACQTSTYNGHRLVSKTGEKVVVTIEYDPDGAITDGPFSVEFGDITLNYSTTDAEEKNVPACTDFDTQIVVDPFTIADRTNITDADGDGKISKNDKVTLGTESFYVISTDATSKTATMLAEWNLNVGNNPIADAAPGMQNEACKGMVDGATIRNCTIAFSSSVYWRDSTESYPAWVYNENSNLYTHVENYASKLKELGYGSVIGRLIRYEELVELGCPENNLGTCSSPSWLKNTSFWSGSASRPTDIYRIDTDGKLAYNYISSIAFGVRPVITINISEI